MSFKVAVAAVFGAAALALAGSAGASAPDKWTDSGTYGPFSSECDGFTDFYAGTFTETGRTIYGPDGTPVKDVIHQSGSELNWRSGSADSYTVYWDQEIHYDYATDTVTQTGKVLRVTYPGLGLLFHDVGTITFSPDGATYHGPHDVFEQGLDAYCNAFIAIANGKK